MSLLKDAAKTFVYNSQRSLHNSPPGKIAEKKASKHKKP